MLELGTETRTEIDREGDGMRRAESGRWGCGRENTGIVPRGADGTEDFLPSPQTRVLWIGSGSTVRIRG